jgi:natural product precursor
MKKTEKKAKKLSLNNETIRNINPSDLAGVVGGHHRPRHSADCSNNGTNIGCCVG